MKSGKISKQNCGAFAGSCLVRSCSPYTVRQQWIEQPHKFSLNVRRSFTEPVKRSHHRQIPSFCTCKSVWNKHEQTILFCPGNRVSLKFNPSLKVSAKNHFFKGSFASQGDSVYLLLVQGRATVQISPDVCSMLREVGRGVDPKCSPSPPSGQALAHSLKSNGSLGTLYLTNNDIGDRGAEALADRT